MAELLDSINQFSGVLTFFSFIVTAIWFVFGTRNLILSFKEDYVKHKEEHRIETAKIKSCTYEIKDEIGKQAIHQEYMRKISEDSTKAINRMNELLTILSGTLHDISMKLK